jgi:DNA-binding Lrp family transcriptional regulator
MGLRAYLLVDVSDETEQQEFIKALRELEEMPGVDFVDPVIGPHDMVIMVDAPVTVEAVANKIRNKEWVKGVEIMRIVSMFERHRAAKKELLKALTHTGV